MTVPINPNRKPFPREFIVEKLLSKLKEHPRRRAIYEPYFRSKNARGYWHDLGAQDVFLDNMGMLVGEQFDDWAQQRRYSNAIHFLLRRWEILQRQVVRMDPFWGKHFNSAQRQANAGEPRSLLRFLADNDLTRMRHAELALWGSHHRSVAPFSPWGDEQTALFADNSAATHEMLPFDEGGLPLFRDGVFENPWHGVWEFAERRDAEDVYEDWTGEGLLPDTLADVYQDISPEDESALLAVTPRGVTLPPQSSPRVPGLRLLHPRHATPDLPLRVGNTPKDAVLHMSLLRDQGSLPTCSAHAVAVGLDILARRQFPRSKGIRFSTIWIHCASGTKGDEGRTLSDVSAVVSRQLPCHEDVLPYGANLTWLSQWKRGMRHPNAPAAERSSLDLTSRLGQPVVRPLAPDDVALIKAHLAAGWVVVVSTTLTDSMIGRGFQNRGLPLTPLVGETRKSEGHAWLLVGYDHVDGNSGWKYQGRFFALNSWGHGFPKRPLLGQGVCALPFATLLTEGIEAFALRFSP